MKTIKASLCAAVAVATVAFASAASAEVTFNVGAATDYVFRGLDQTGPGTDGEVFGGIDWTGGPNLYAGAWLSNTGPSSDNGIEADYYAGWKPKLGPVSLDLGAIYYTYSDSDFGAVDSDFNTLEWKLAGSIGAGPATLGAAVYYSDDVASSDEESWYYELNASVPVKEKVLLSAAIGQFKSDQYSQFDAALSDKYTTWNVGVTVPVTDTFSLDARYIGTENDARDFGAAVGDRLIGTIKATF